MGSRITVIVIGTLACVLVALAPTAERKLETRWLFNEGSEYAAAEEQLRAAFGHDATLAILVRGPHSAEAEAQARRLASELQRTGHAEVRAPWIAPQAAPLLRPEGSPMLVVDVDTELREYHQAARLARAAIAAAVDEPVSAHVVGVPIVGTAVGDESSEASHEGERLAAPILLLVLLFILRSPLAVAIPLLLGVVTVQAGRGLVSVLAEAFVIDPLVLSMISTMGLALGVDYGLLMVARFREELIAHEPREAAMITQQTAGRTVLFAGIALLLGLGLLMALPIESVVRSFALGAFVTALGALGLSTLVVPWVLARFGHAINRWYVGRPRSEEGRWMRLVRRLGRRPGLTAALVVVPLLALAWPSSNLDLAAPDYRQLPQDTRERQDFDVFERIAGAGWNNSFELVVSSDRPLSHRDAIAVRELERAVGATGGIRQVAGPARLLTSSGSAAPEAAARLVSADRTTLRVLAIPAMSANDPEASELYDRLVRLGKDFQAESGLQVGVAGPAAWLVDVDRDAVSQLPVLIVALSSLTFLVLLVVFGSPLLALIAVALNLLTVACCFGALSLLASAGFFGETEFLDAIGITVIFTVIFGLSIDYEVFLLTRIKEAWESSGDSVAAIDRAIERTGGVLTGAAVILCAVFLAFATTDIVPLRQVGVGLAIAIALDATVIRLVLLPALLRLAGDRAWWAPPWLDRLLPSLGVEAR